LAILPLHLQSDILEQVRAPVLMNHPFFHSLLFESPYIMRMICCNVVKTVSAVKDEKLFDKGDYCERMLFTDKISCIYGIPFDLSLADTSRMMKSSAKASSQAQDSMPRPIAPNERVQLISEGVNGKPIRQVRTDSWISEAALWVEWRNQGRMVANAHGVILAVGASALATGLRNEHQGAYSLASLHGLNVARELSHQDPRELSDILPFEVQLYSPIYVDVTIVSAAGLRNADGLFNKSDPYCLCRVSNLTGNGSEVRFKTKVEDNTVNPVWNCTHAVLLSRHQFIEFAIFDQDIAKMDQELGVARLQPEDFSDGFDGDLHLDSQNGEQAPGSLRVKIQVLDVEPEAQHLLNLLPRQLTLNSLRALNAKKKKGFNKRTAMIPRWRSDGCISSHDSSGRSVASSVRHAHDTSEKNQKWG